MKNVLPQQITDLAAEIGMSINKVLEVQDANDPNRLDDPWRTQLIELKGKLNASLEQLPPTDQVPASQEAHWGLRSIYNSLLCVQAMTRALEGGMSSRGSAYATALNSIPAKIDEGVTAKLATGDYVTRDAATQLAGTARTEGETAGFQRGKILGDRRQALAIAGLPVEVASKAPDAVLTGEEAAFTAAAAAAKVRVDKLSGLGLTVATAAFATLPWEAQETFEAQVATFEAIKGSGKGTSTNAAPPAAKLNPFIAGPAGAEKPTDKSEVKPVFMF